MRKGTVLILLTLICYLQSQGQDIIIEGVYQGKNLYVLNPCLDSIGKQYCVNAVYVNDIRTEDELQSSSFEIDFSNLSLTSGRKVKVRIAYNHDCKPLVINSNVLEYAPDFTLNSPKIDRKNNNLTWSITGEIDQNSFLIEQYRWDKWVTLGELSPKDSTKSNCYTFEVKFNTKNNIFRVRHIDKTGYERISKECKYFSKGEEIFIISTRISDWLYFSGETLYEVFDENGNFILDGYGKEVNFSDIDKGKYWVNYDNQTDIINKK